MNADLQLLDQAATSHWSAYVATDDGDVCQHGRLTHDRTGRVVFAADGTLVTLIDATRTAGGVIVGRTETGHEIVVRPTPRTADR